MKTRMISKSLLETAQFAEEIAKKLTPGTLIALYGTMGSGKTTFAKGIISFLTEIQEETITSPTFTYMHLYETKTKDVVCHFDLYRLNNSEDFLMAGFEEYLHAPYITLIEWPERIEDLLIMPHKKIVLSVIDEETRSFSCS